MKEDLEKRLDSICRTFHVQKVQFEQAAECCVKAIEGMNTRLERLEKWMIKQEKIKQ